MIHGWPPLARKLLALALLFVPLATIAGVMLGPVSAHIADIKDRIEQERLVAGRFSQLVNRDAGETDPSKRTEEAKDKELFVSGTSEAIRLSNLQSMLANIVTANGLKLRSTRALRIREKNELRLLGVQIQLQASIDKLQALLLDIEKHRPALLVSGMHVFPMMNARVPGSQTLGQLDAHLDVFAVEERQP